MSLGFSSVTQWSQKKIKQSPEGHRGVRLFPSKSEEMDRYAALTEGRGIRRKRNQLSCTAMSEDAFTPDQQPQHSNVQDLPKAMAVGRNESAQLNGVRLI